jgi:hypothetical protein
MPTFRQYLKQNKIAYAFKTFAHLKELQPPTALPAGQPSMSLQQIGDAVNQTVGGALSTAGMSETAANLAENVNAAVEEVDDILKGQRKKVDFVGKAVKVQKTAEKLKRKPTPKRGRRIQREVMQALMALDRVEEHEDDNPAQKKIGKAVLSDPEHMEHLIASTVEAMHEKAPTESWGRWLLNLFRKLWGGVTAIWNFIRSNTKIIASVILIVYIVYAAYTQGFQQLVSSASAAAASISEQVVTVANWIWQACQGIFDFGFKWLIQFPIWFIQSILGQTNELYKLSEMKARANLFENRMKFGAALLNPASVSAGSGFVATAAAWFGISTGGLGLAALAAAAAGAETVAQTANANYRQDLVSQDREFNFTVLIGILSFVYSLRSVKMAFLRRAKKMGISEEKAQTYYNTIGTLSSLGATGFRTKLRIERRINRLFSDVQMSTIANASQFVGLNEFGNAVRRSNNNTWFGMNSKLNAFTMRLQTGDVIEREMNDIKIHQAMQTRDFKQKMMSAYTDAQLEKLEEKAIEKDGQLVLTKENLDMFVRDMEQETSKDGNVYADSDVSDAPTEERTPGELSDAPTEERTPGDFSPEEKMSGDLSDAPTERQPPGAAMFSIPLRF